MVLLVFIFQRLFYIYLAIFKIVMVFIIQTDQVGTEQRSNSFSCGNYLSIQKRHSTYKGS